MAPGPSPSASSDPLSAALAHAQGLLAEQLRTRDFGTTLLGPIAGWSRALRGAVASMLHQPRPVMLLWGPRFVQLYDDAQIPIMGERHPDAFGRPFEESWPQSFGPMAQQLAQVKGGKTVVVEHQKIRLLRLGREEETFWSYDLIPVFDDDGTVGGVWVTGRESTARDNILMQAPIGVAILNGPNLVYQLANPIYHALVGRKEGELVGRPIFDVLTEVRGTPAETMLRNVYAKGERALVRNFPAQLDRAGNGQLEQAWFDFTFEPMRGLDGQVEGLIALANETTHEVEAREGLQAHQREREQLVMELESANRAKDEFLAMLGHELRNPLAPIATALKLIAMDANASHPKERQVIERQVAHLVRLVDDLLDVSKIARGKIELHRETVSVNEVVSRAVEQASVLLEQRRHNFERDVPAGLTWTMDPLRVAQVISNLLTNAAKYTPEGGRISLKAGEVAGALEIAVSDSGMGISPEALPHLFELFYQSKRTFDRAEGGLGLGLTLVKNLVGLHGGEVRATSEGSGKGSTFVLRLPKAEPVAPKRTKTESATRAAVTPAQRRKVLVVDDNTDAAELLTGLLERRGHQVEVAYDPLKALELAASFQPEVAVLDIGLPVMDGYELGQRLLSSPGKAPKLIALTGYGQDHDRERSAQAGFSAHLVKPVDIEKLMALIAP